MYAPWKRFTLAHFDTTELLEHAQCNEWNYATD